MAYDLLQAQQDIASLRGQIAHLLATFEGINVTVDGQLLVQNPIKIVQPSTSVAETWHDMRPLINSFVGTIAGQYPPQYRLAPDGFVEVVGWVKSPPITGNYNGVSFFNIPAAYRPTTGPHSWLITGIADAAASPKVSVTTAGDFILNFTSATLAQTTFSIYGRYPLDSTGLILS